jgi:hypothetical protein
MSQKREPFRVVSFKANGYAKAGLPVFLSFRLLLNKIHRIYLPPLSKTSENSFQSLFVRFVELITVMTIIHINSIQFNSIQFLFICVQT